MVLGDGQRASLVVLVWGLLGVLSGAGAAEPGARANPGPVAPAPHAPWRDPNPPFAVPTPQPEAPIASARALTLAELTDLALRNNPRTRAAWAQARADLAAVGVEQAAGLPQLAFLFSATRQQQIAAQSGAVIPIQNRYGPTVTLSYLLYDFGRLAAAEDAARLRLLAANLTQNRTLQEVVFQVEQAYFRLIGLEQLVKANEQSSKNAETTLDATRRRHEGGLATIGDVSRAETAVGQARLALRRNEGEVSKARGQLAAVCGVPVNATFTLQPWDERVPQQEVKQSVDALLTQAKSSRQDLVAAEARVRSSYATLEATRRERMPVIELTSNYGRTFFTDSRPSAEAYGIGLNVRIPLFDGYRNSYSVARAEALAEQAAAIRDQLFSQTEVEVWQSYFDLQTAATAIESTTTLVKGATLTADVAASRYASGVGNLLDLLTAQADETNAQVQLIQSKLDWHTALARLHLAVGAANLIPAEGAK
jgi:outer membrane protein TolC